MQSAAARSLSADLQLPEIVKIDTASHFTRPLSLAREAGRREEKGRLGAASHANREEGRLCSTGCSLDFGGKSQVCLWPGSTHAHLVGLLAFSRFQSTVPAFEGPPKGSAPASSDGSAGGRIAEPTTDDGQGAALEAARLFDAWMSLAEPASCVEVFRAVEACAGGRGADTGGSGGNGTGSGSGGRQNVEADCSASEMHGQPRWDVVKEQCFRAMAEEGRGPRPASLEEVLLLFKHFCRLGCRRRVALETRTFCGVVSVATHHLVCASES